MREYIIQLQSRLLDVVGEFPHPPAALELRDPRSGEPLRSAEALRTSHEGDGQGGPPPLPQPSGAGQAPTATMSHEYVTEGAEGKVGESSPLPYPSYEAAKMERPSRPSPDAAAAAPSA